MFSACGGIGSGQIAADHAGLKVKSIGMSDVDEGRIAIYQKANPDVPVYGALGAVTAALECGDLVLDPTVLELTAPCQAHSHCGTRRLVPHCTSTRSVVGRAGKADPAGHGPGRHN
jgi:site-specific DNA-cytosine methylase